MTFTTPSNRKIDIMIISSNYHIEVNPSDAGIYDRVVVVELVKQIAQTHQIDSGGQKNFKVIVLTHVDQLTKDAQNALRRTMEKYSATCRLILCVNSTSHVIPAIKSRCLGIRVSAPTETEIVTILQSLAKKENLVLQPELASRIANKSERNLRRAILMLEACKVHQYPFTVNQEIFEPDWKLFIKETSSQILYEQTPAKLEKIRDRLYELLSQSVPPDTIFKELVDDLIKNCDITIKAEVIKYAAMYEYRMQQGSKHIFHFEAFVARFMAIYKKFISETMVMDEF
jgi:replication factor C subunit 3/5